MTEELTVNSVTFAETLPGLLDDVMSDRQPERWRLGPGRLSDIRMGPGRIAMIGAPPSWSKTALALQLAVDALRATPDLRLLMANVEMPAGELSERILARLCGISLGRLMNRQLLPEEKERLRQHGTTFQAVAGRITFLKPPFDMAHVAAAAIASGSRLVVLDYVQRFKPAQAGNFDSRSAMAAVMSEAREIANDGHGLIVVAATNRGQNGDYKDLSLGSFRDSSELEYGVNDAFILEQLPDAVGTMANRRLRHVKHRNEKLADIDLSFDGSRQSFRVVEGGVK